MAATTIRSKLRTILGDMAMAFNGVWLRLDGNGGIKIQPQYNHLALTLPRDRKDFSSKCTMTEYIGVNCRPDISAPVQLIAPGRNSTIFTGYKTFKRVIKRTKDTADM